MALAAKPSVVAHHQAKAAEHAGVQPLLRSGLHPRGGGAQGLRPLGIGLGHQGQGPVLPRPRGASRHRRALGAGRHLGGCRAQLPTWAACCGPVVSSGREVKRQVDPVGLQHGQAQGREAGVRLQAGDGAFHLRGAGAGDHEPQVVGIFPFELWLTPGWADTTAATASSRSGGTAMAERMDAPPLPGANAAPMRLSAPSCASWR